LDQLWRKYQELTANFLFARESPAIQPADIQVMFQDSVWESRGQTRTPSKYFSVPALMRLLTEAKVRMPGRPETIHRQLS